jgi:YVTN family beta-propeller protein
MEPRSVGRANVRILAIAVIIALLGIAVGGYFALQPRPSGGREATLVSTVAGATTTTTVTVTKPTLITISGAQGSAKSSTKVAAITVGSGTSAPQGIAVNPANGAVYVALMNSSSVAVINGTSAKVITTLALAKGSQPVALAFDPVNKLVYVANSNSSTISVIDSMTNTVKSPITVPDTTNDIDVNPSTNTIYAASNDNDAVFVVSGATNQVTTIQNHTHIPDNAASVAVDPTKNMVVVGNFYDTKTVAQLGFIDGYRNTVTTEMNITGGQITGVAVNSNTGVAYVANYKANLVNVVSESGKIIANISVPSPHALAINPNTNRIFVASPDSNSIVVISGTQNSIVGTINVGKGPIDVAVDPNSNKIYASNQLDGTVSAIDGSSLGF